MDKQSIETISLWQLFLIIVLSNIGSSLVLNIGAEAKNDAWIAIFLASLAGVLIFIFNTYLASLYPQQILFDMFKKGFGKHIGMIVTCLYVVFFLLNCAMVARDWGELMVSTIFARTPMEVVILLIIIASGYILLLGIEVFGRIAEIFMPYFLLILLFIGLGLLFSKEIKISNLEPILGEGIQPVLSTIFPYHITFPFGEVITFLVVIPYISNIRRVRKWGSWAVFVSGMILMYSTLLEVMTLKNLFNRTNFPLMAAASEISLLHFIERVDLFVVFNVMIAVLFKLTIFFYAALKGIEHLFKTSYRSFIFPLVPIISFISILIGKNYTEYRDFDKIFPFVQIPFQFIIPALLMMVGLIMRKLRRRQQDEIFQKEES